MEQCKIHEKFDDRLRTCEGNVAHIQTNAHAHEKKIDCLFTYHDELKALVANTREELLEIKINQKGSLSILKDINEALQAHLRDYANFKTELRSFDWFRNQMNWLKDKLPWWILLGIIVIILVLAMTSNTVITKVAKFFMVN